MSPAKSMPQQTGLVKQTDGRYGVFIRDVDAIVYAADLRDIIRDGQYTTSWMDRHRIKELAELLESVKPAQGKIRTGGM